MARFQITSYRIRGSLTSASTTSSCILEKFQGKSWGEYRDSRVKDETGQSIRKEINNEKFTQERIDVLLEAGMKWHLNTAQVNSLKERGLKFPAPDGSRPDDGDMIGLEKHAWLTMFEALVEFKRVNRHTFVSKANSSEELYHWVCTQRKKMKQLDKGGGALKDKAFNDYQAEMLSGIGFVYSKPDIDWMENYERLCCKSFVCYARKDMDSSYSTDFSPFTHSLQATFWDDCSH